MEKPISAKLRKQMEYENAVEVWELHDSVLISKYVDENSKYQGVGFYNGYAALGAAAEIPFFTIRNSSIVDQAYCNFDSKDKMNFGFHCFSLGIEFIAPTFDGGENPNATMRSQTFAAELPKHASFVLTLNQDEKVVSTINLVPSGMGVQGSMNESMDPAHSPAQNVQVAQNGWPSIKNRWEFKGPLRIPRNVTIKGTLQFSSIGRAILAGMESPSLMNVNGDPQPGQGTGNVWQAAMIRVSMFGVREVQMRNLQHF